MKLIICNNTDEMAKVAAKYFINLINTNSHAVLGLATGSTPIKTYNELIKDHEINKTDWSDVTTFNLDEYVGLDGTHNQSYRYFMNEHLFNHVNINKHNTHVPQGVGNLAVAAAKYDQDIDRAGGVDLQILGIGTNGHIAFNEPGTDFDSKTHVLELTQQTRQDNSRMFASIDEVPTHAITMGVGSILKAKQIILLANGENKAEAIARLMSGNQDKMWTCTALQQHKNVVVIIDKDAAKLLNKVM